MAKVLGTIPASNLPQLHYTKGKTIMLNSAEIKIVTTRAKTPLGGGGSIRLSASMTELLFQRVT